MTTKEWKELRNSEKSSTMDEFQKTEYFKRYCEFMYDRNNIRNCAECPENIGDEGYNRYLCGQYRCWVAMHCNHGGI